MTEKTISAFYTAFHGHQKLAAGALPQVILAVKQVADGSATEPLHIYSDATGRVVDVDLRGTVGEVEARFHGSTDVSASAHEDGPESAETRGRGRPKLGVIAREVTLLPRHWDWLNAQPGGASVALRKLVEEARRTSGDGDRQRKAQAAAYHFMSAIAGDLPGFEEATRALFAYDRRKFSALIAEWPEDVRDHAIKLAFADLNPGKS